jgi:hypothetical protein
MISKRGPDREGDQEQRRAADQLVVRHGRAERPAGQQRDGHRQAQISGVDDDHAADQRAQLRVGEPQAEAADRERRAAHDGHRQPGEGEPDPGSRGHPQMGDVDERHERDQHVQHHHERPARGSAGPGVAALAGDADRRGQNHSDGNEDQ